MGFAAETRITAGNPKAPAVPPAKAAVFKNLRRDLLLIFPFSLFVFFAISPSFQSVASSVFAKGPTSYPTMMLLTCFLIQMTVKPSYNSILALLGMVSSHP
jgi:hypothetical protein